MFLCFSKNPSEYVVYFSVMLPPCLLLHKLVPVSAKRCQVYPRKHRSHSMYAHCLRVRKAAGKPSPTSRVERRVHRMEPRNVRTLICLYFRTINGSIIWPLNVIPTNTSRVLLSAHRFVFFIFIKKISLYYEKGQGAVKLSYILATSISFCICIHIC